MAKTPRKSFHIGASRIRQLVEELPRMEALKLITTLWPEISPKVAMLVIKHPEETRVNGSQLLIPASWENL